jgi:hypothetical protein
MLLGVSLYEKYKERVNFVVIDLDKASSSTERAASVW